MIHFLRLIRWPNLLLIALTQMLYIDKNISKNEIAAFCIVTLTIGVAAAGYIVNDIYDEAIDRINKPQKVIVNQWISSKKAWIYYGILSGLALISALWLSIIYGNVMVLSYVVLISLVLWCYARWLKKTPLFGNIVIAILCTMTLTITEAFFDITHRLQEHYLYFVLLSTLFREIIKDCEDLKGDKLQGALTLPAWIGIPFSKYLAASVAFGLAILVYSTTAIDSYFYLSMVVFILLLALIINTLRAKTVAQFHLISQATKLLMLLGLGYLVL